MAAISTGKARNQFAELINRTAYGKQRSTLTRRGKEVAAVVPIEDLRLLELLEDRLDLEQARQALAEEGEDERWEDLKAELGL